VVELRSQIERHLTVLVEEIGARPPGSPANRRASDYVAGVLRGAGLDVTELPFETRWWEVGDGRLTSRTGTVAVQPNPYSAAGDVTGAAVLAGTIEELGALEPDPAAILVVHGDLTAEQLMPAAFPFLDLPDHERIRAALHRLRPAGLVAVTDHWEPFLEDPELAFPSTTVMTAVGGDLRAGEELRLAVGGRVHPGTGSMVSARQGEGPRRVVLSAHLDSKATTPGAFDNAASVATILALAEAGALGSVPLEIALFNGEDHFDACGEMAWLAATDLGEVMGNLNVDGVGLTGHGTSVAMLACPDELATAVRGWLAEREGWVLAEPWFESDHAIFAMQGIPALAVTTEDVQELLGGLAHTPSDTREVLDPLLLDSLADAIPELLALLAAAEG